MNLGLYILSSVYIIIVITLIILLAVQKYTVKQDMILRFSIVYLTVIFLFILILYRILVLQYIEGDKLRALNSERTSCEKVIHPQRGNILSKDGRLMASSIPTYYLYMDLAADALAGDHPREKDRYRKRFYRELPELADSMATKFKDRTAAEYKRDILKAYKSKSGRRREFRLYPKAISYIDYLEVKKFPILKRGRIRGGFYSKKRVTRSKPFGSLASRTIGNIYGVTEKGGSCGLELKYDNILRGEEGSYITRKMAGKRTDITTKKARNGNDIVSTIDIDLQEVTERSLRQQLIKSGAKSGCAILMETSTGKINAISNLIQRKDGTYGELGNIAVSSQIEPGSTFKTLSLMVAIEDGLIDTSTIVNTTGGIYKFGDRNMKDWNYRGKVRGGFGYITASKALEMSSNLGVSILIDSCYKEQPQKFIDGIKKTGFDTPINFDIIGHGKVEMKNADNKRWSRTTLPWMSIGYEVQVPPIYTLLFYNAIANNGKMMSPIFVNSIQRNGKDIETFSPKIIKKQICSENTLHQIQGMLEKVVIKGTAKPAKSTLFGVAGKTGTAQIFEGGSNRDKDGHKRHQYTFCGYFPTENPTHSCIVYIREPSKYISSGRTCGKAFKEIAEATYIKNGGISSIETTDSTNIKLPNLNIKPNSPKKVISTIMPNLQGLTARDAVFYMENLNIKVKLIGSGKVYHQSIKKGNPLTQVAEVTLRLN